MSYPDLPSNRLIVNGIDISIRFQMVLVDGYTLEPPEPKTYTVDVPGGNGVIDLTESLTGDVVYKNRKQEFIFDIIDVKNFEKVKTEISNFLHGKAFDYTMTMDPGYTYHGRFSVESYNHSSFANGLLGQIKISIDANPYKLKEHCSYKLNATGGRYYSFESGRRPVHPVLECTQPCFITFKGIEYTVPAGTHRLNDILFNDGMNDIYVNTSRLWYIIWDEIGENKNYPLTWEDAHKYTWDSIQKLSGETKDAPSCWADVSNKTWADVADKRWSEMDYRRENVPDTTAYFIYDWEDL